MEICFHKDPVLVADLCADLNMHGAVYWHTTRTHFRAVFNRVKEQELNVLPLAVNIEGDFLNYIIQGDLVAQDGLDAIAKRVAQAIIRWEALGEPVPHTEPL